MLIASMPNGAGGNRGIPTLHRPFVAIGVAHIDFNHDDAIGTEVFRNGGERDDQA